MGGGDGPVRCEDENEGRQRARPEEALTLQLIPPGRPLRWQRATLILFFSIFLLLSGAAKLLDNQGYARSLTNWDLFPRATIPFLGLALGLSEFTAGLGLLAGGRRRRSGASLLVALCVFYVILDATALARGLNVPNMGTFGVHLPTRLTGARLIQDSFLLLLAIVLRRFQNRRAADHGAFESPVRWVARR